MYKCIVDVLHEMGMTLKLKFFPSFDLEGKGGLTIQKDSIMILGISIVPHCIDSGIVTQHLWGAFFKSIFDELLQHFEIKANDLMFQLEQRKPMTS